MGAIIRTSVYLVTSLGGGRRPFSRKAELLDGRTELEQAIYEPVHIQAPDPEWPARFEEEKARLLAALPGRFVVIEHFGSTAVPELSAKPIIDILAGVERIEDADALLEPLCALGYTTSAEFNATLTDRRWLMRQANGRRTHHLHVAVIDTPRWRDQIRFRDLLRRDPQLRGTYLALKERLAREHREDREAFTDAKAEFIQAALRTAA